MDAGSDPLDSQDPFGSGDGVSTVLRQGLNEILWQGETRSIVDALRPIDDAVIAVFQWVNTDQVWLIYNPLLPPVVNSVDTFVFFEIYWIAVSRTVDLTIF